MEVSFCNIRQTILLISAASLLLIPYSSSNAQTVTVNPLSLSFGSVVLNTSSLGKSVVLKNGQSTGITISGITTSLGDFSQTSNCPVSPATLASGSSCTISIFFTPTATSPRSGALNVTDDGASSPQVVSLSGTGIQPVTAIPTSLFFGSQAIGQQSSATTVSVKNNQKTSLTIAGITTSLADYMFTSNCPISPGTLLPAASCSISVFFTPVVSGARTGTLTIADDASLSPVVSLNGTGVVAATVSPTSLSFTSQVVGTTSVAKTVTLTNNQSSGLSIAAITSNSSDFSITSNCPLSPNALAAKSKCTASVVFSPKATGSRTGTLSFNDSANNSPQNVTLTGTGTAVKLTSLVVTPASGSVAVGQSAQFTATGNYSDGSSKNLTSSVTWSSSATAVATISSTGLALGRSNGTAVLTATSGTVTGSASLNIAPAALVSLAVTPTAGSIALGTTQQFAAVGTYSDGSTLALTNSVSWSSSNASVASVDSKGLATSVAIGSTGITATMGTIVGFAALNVTPAALVSLAITPAIPSVALGMTQQFTATGTFTDHSTQDLTNLVQWSSSAPAIATISNATNSIGVATSINTGSAQITATLGSISGSTTINVTAATLQSIAVTPANASLPLGTTQQFLATGTFSDSSTQDLSSSVLWGSDSPSTATVNKVGTVTSTGIGTANISASSSNLTSSASVIVTAAALVSVAVYPPTAAVALGSTQQFTATGTYSDGTTQDLTASGHWSSNAAAIATISNSPGTTGQATALSPGLSTIGFDMASVSASAMFTVNPPALISIAITPRSSTIALGTAQTFTATGTYSDGSTQDVSSLVTWSSSSATIAVVSNTSGTNGIATSAGVGSVVISATSGSVSSSANLTVAQASLLSLAVTPASIGIALGSGQQFAATGTYSDGSTQDVTAAASWTSSSGTVATVSNQGLATSLSVGSTTITAAFGTATGSAILNVSPVTVLLSLSIAPTSGSIALGTTKQFAAVGTYSDGSTMDLTNTVIWTVANAAVATVNNAGLAFGVSAGATTITASAGAVIGSGTLSVTPAVLTSLAITPATSSVSLGITQQFVATGAFTDGSTQDLTKLVQWSSNALTIATISNATNSIGLATTVGTGSAQITATSGSITNSTTLNVTAAILESIAVTPAYPSIALGTTQQFAAIGTFSDGSTQDLSSSVTWVSDTLSTATVNKTGLAASTGTGTANISAGAGGVMGSTGLIVTAATLVSLAIAPQAVTVPLGAKPQFVATGTYTDSTTQDLTTSGHWTSTVPSIATVSNSPGTQGLATTLSAGMTAITIAMGSVNASAALIVNSAVPTFTEYVVSSSPSAICRGPGSTIWFGEEAATANSVGEIAIGGTITLLVVPTANAGLGGCTTGPDGLVYFTETRTSKVLQVDPVTLALREFTLPQSNANPGGIVVGSDNLLWIMETSTNLLVRMSTSGTFSPAYSLPAGSFPHGPSLGTDGNVWFAELQRNRIARITPNGALTEWLLPQAGSIPDTTIWGADGVYFTESSANKIGRIIPGAGITQWSVPTGGSNPVGITVGSNGNLYFAEKLGNKIGVLPVGGGAITELPIPTAGSQPDKITQGSDGAVWFTEHAGIKVGRLN